jgi:predicted O-methyltransferase YrrM
MRTPDYPSADAERWEAVDSYFSSLLVPPDEVLDSTLAANVAGGLPIHDVSALQGKMLALYVRMCRAARVLEIGTLGAYSSIWMARALPEGGELISLEVDPVHAEIARCNVERAGLSHSVTILTGVALDILPTLTGPFDLIFIDADKPNNPAYLDWALRLSRRGSVIIGDNVVRGGAVIDAASDDDRVLGVRSFVQMMAEDPRIDATAIQTVGEKGWDGFTLAIVR